MSQVASRIEKQILALSASDPSLSQSQLAKMVNRSTKTIQRVMKANKATIEEIDTKLRTLNNEIASVVSMKQRAVKYADLAINAKNEAVSLGALARIDDLDGIVTDKERLRSQGVEHSAPAPMFSLPPGTQVNVTVMATTGREPSGLHKIPTETLEITPTTRSTQDND